MFEKIRQNLEGSNISLIQWITAFSGILMIRFFLEALSSTTSSGIIASDAPTLIHYYLFFTAVSIILILLLEYALPTWKKIIPIISLFALTLLFVPPIIDWVISIGKGFTMTYIFQTPSELIHSFLTFFGPSITKGITVGIRTELIIMLVGVGYFVYSIKKNIKHMILTVLLLYIIMFVAVSIPSIISGVSNLFNHNSIGTSQFIQNSILNSTTLSDNIHGTLRYESLQRMLEIGFDFMMSRIWFLIIVLLMIIWFVKNFRIQTIEIFKNTRIERTLHYLFMIFFGICVAYTQKNFSLNWNDWLTLITLLLSFYFSWMFAVCVNDIFDTKIDSISSPERPLFSGNLSEDHMKAAALLFLILSLVGSYLSGYYAFFCILAFTALYYIYSAPPLRLKRLPFLSILIIGFCSLAAVMAGFFTFSTAKEVSAFPPEIILGIVVFFTLLPQVKDIKDIEGDRAAGIVTVPILFGPVWGLRVVGVLAAISYTIISILTHSLIILIGSIPAAIITYWICVRKPYTERPIFIVYGLFAIFFGIVLLYI